jgi:hypothetical protein
MPRIPYERVFLRGWIRYVAERLVSPALDDAPPQTTYERTFRWHLGEGERPSLFLFRRCVHEGGARAGSERNLTPFDAVLIDGHHDYEWVRHALAERGACVRSGGVILVQRRPGGFERALLALHAWAADGAVSVRWPRQAGLEIAKVFEDLREAALDDVARPEHRHADLRDLREDFEHEALSEARHPLIGQTG